MGPGGALLRLADGSGRVILRRGRADGIAGHGSHSGVGHLRAADCAEGRSSTRCGGCHPWRLRLGYAGSSPARGSLVGRTPGITSLASYGLTVEVRHLLQDERGGLALSASFQIGARAVTARGWTFDACVKTFRQLQDVEGLASAVPELRIVLDHLGKPVVGTASAPATPAADWVRALGELARHSQVFCKLAGLPAEAWGDWSPSQVEPFLDAATQAFGPERLMWGSDWPVSAVRRDVAGIMFQNAATFYGVAPGPGQIHSQDPIAFPA